nr:MAG TPA: hypothetical protein [Caudoviricetes sp.]
MDENEITTVADTQAENTADTADTSQTTPTTEEHYGRERDNNCS